MAKARVEVGPIKVNRGVLLTMVTRSNEYRTSVVEAKAKRDAEHVQAIAEAHYQAALGEIADLFEDGVSGVAAGRKTLNIDTPLNGRIKVAVGWNPLSNSWLDNKRARARAGYSPGSKPGRPRGKLARGRSHGPNSFWLDEKKFSTAFGKYRGLGKVSVVPEIRELKNGDYELRYTVRFAELKSAYLDVAIRRSLIRGAEGGEAVADLPTSYLPTASRPRGIARGAWPEVMRPTMRPIARRMGLALQKHIINSLGRK